MPPPPGGAHGAISNDIAALAGSYVIEHDLGQGFAAETGFLIARDPDTVRGPDWAFIKKDRLSGAVIWRHVPVPPDLVLETRSPSDSRAELGYKVEIWLQAGATLVWEVDPEAQRVTVHRAGRAPQFLTAKDTLEGEDLLPGFRLPLSKVFKERVS
jgi:Uma2 family endonuclease